METIGSCNKISSVPPKTYSRKKVIENKTGDNPLKQCGEMLGLNKNEQSEIIKNENEARFNELSNLPKNSISKDSKDDANDFYTFNCEKTETNATSAKEFISKPVGRNPNEKRLLIYSPRNTDRREITYTSPIHTNKKILSISSIKDSPQKSMNRKLNNSAKDSNRKQDYKCSSKAILLSSVITLSRDWSASRKTYARHTSPPIRVQSRNNYDSFINKNQENDDRSNINCDSSEKSNEKILNNSSHVNNSSEKSFSEDTSNNDPASIENNQTIDNLNSEKITESTFDSFCSFLKNNPLTSTPENSNMLKHNKKTSQKSVSFASDGCIDLPQSSLTDNNVNIENPYEIDLSEGNDSYVNNVSDLPDQLNDKNQNEINKETLSKEKISSENYHKNLESERKILEGIKPKGKRGRPRKNKETTEQNTKSEIKLEQSSLSEDQKNNSVSKPVRKRGRPRKILNDKVPEERHDRSSVSDNNNEQLPNINVTTQEQACTPKPVRKRGRPRKHPIIYSSENESRILNSTTTDEKRLKIDSSGIVNGKLFQNEKNVITIDDQTITESCNEVDYKMNNLENSSDATKTQKIIDKKTNRDHIKRRDTLICGVCKEEYDALPRIKYHIMAVHNGLARINDENTSFTPHEELLLYKKNLRLIKRLTCTQPNCGKKFSSILGYQYHKKICGVEVQKAECKVCGKHVKVTSMAIHIRSTHRERQEVVPATNEELPRRGAALKAIEKMESFMKIEKESPENEESNKEETDDSEYLESDNESNKYEYKYSDSDDYYDEDGDSRYFFMELLDPWKGLFYSPSDQLKEVTEGMILSWEKSLTDNGKINCDKMNCKKEFTDINEMKIHYRHCGNQSKKWMCRICGKFYLTGPMFLYNHMKKYHFNEDVKNYSDKTGKSLYSDFHQPPSSTYSYAARGSLLKPYSIAMEWALKFYQKHNKNEVFPQWKPCSSDWIQMTEREYKDYLPPLSESSRLRLSSDETGSSWTRMKLFDNIHSKSEDSANIFFVGGAVWGTAWCPNPLGISTDQFLAVAACDPEAHYLTKTKKCKGLIQLWDVGNLEKNYLTKAPKLALAIAHENGEIWDLTWCPSGCWEEVVDLQNDAFKKSGNKLPRLGLLAAACSDGTVKIYSIPHPCCLGKNENILPVFKSKASIVLVSPQDGPNISCSPTICTKISWQRTSSHSHLAAGYGNGLICIWNLMSSSPLLIVFNNQGQLTLRPYMSFPAHSACITALIWLPIPGNRYIATAGYDKTAKVWDLQDQYWPSILNDKRGLVRDLAWLPHWCGMFESMDDCYNLYHTSTIYKECGYHGFQHKVLSVHFSTIWSLSVSDWLNVEASGSAGGDMVIVVLCQLMKYVDQIKQMGHRRVPLYKISMEPLHDKNESEEECLSNTESDDDLTERSSENAVTDRRKTLPTYKKAVETFGLVFQDNNIADFGGIATSEFQRVLKPENMTPAQPNLYPLSSINKVAWNPNFGSHLWLVSAGQAGLLKLSCISGLNNKDLKAVFIKCKEACKTQTKDL